ncbi:MAG: DsrH/TusB family sulfur metabolism protein [Candidatus Sulfobium sp.]|jgi:sulfur relay protein TusB/DsrH
MIVMIKSAPDTPEGKRGAKIARDTSADIVLLQNAAYFLKGGDLKDLGFLGKAYVLEDDRRLRGLRATAMNDDVRDIDYSGLVDLIAESDKVLGMF